MILLKQFQLLKVKMNLCKMIKVYVGGDFSPTMCTLNQYNRSLNKNFGLF